MRYFLVFIGLIGVYVLTLAIAEMWHICLPLAVVMICMVIGSILKLIVRVLFQEKESTKQHFAEYISQIPIEAYIVYLLWPVKLWLAIAYGVLVLISLFINVINVEKGY